MAKQNEILRQRGIELLNSWRNDWNKFIREVLGANLDKEQQAIVSSVQHNPRTSVVSGTARGKDFVAACSAVCFLFLTPRWNSSKELIENTKDSYYECLQQSSKGWHENANDYEPFVQYMLGIVTAAYREFSSRVKLITAESMSKPDRVKEIIKNTLGTITKKEILERCTDISQVTVQRTLADLTESGEIIKIGGGRYTKYTWNRD